MIPKGNIIDNLKYHLLSASVDTTTYRITGGIVKVGNYFIAITKDDTGAKVHKWDTAAGYSDFSSVVSKPAISSSEFLISGYNIGPILGLYNIGVNDKYLLIYLDTTTAIHYTPVLTKDVAYAVNYTIINVSDDSVDLSPVLIDYKYHEASSDGTNSEFCISPYGEFCFMSYTDDGSNIHPTVIRFNLFTQVITRTVGDGNLTTTENFSALGYDVDDGTYFYYWHSGVLTKMTLSDGSLATIDISAFATSANIVRGLPGSPGYIYIYNFSNGIRILNLSTVTANTIITPRSTCVNAVISDKSSYDVLLAITGYLGTIPSFYKKLDMYKYNYDTEALTHILDTSSTHTGAGFTYPDEARSEYPPFIYSKTSKDIVMCSCIMHTSTTLYFYLITTARGSIE